MACDIACDGNSDDWTDMIVAEEDAIISIPVRESRLVVVVGVAVVENEGLCSRRLITIEMLDGGVHEFTTCTTAEAMRNNSHHDCLITVKLVVVVFFLVL